MAGLARRLLRAHVLRRAERRPRQRVRVAAGGRGAGHRLGGAGRIRRGGRLGQAPVDDQGLAEGAEHDVRGLEVAVDHPPAVGVGDRVADVDEPPEELAERERPLAGGAPAVLRVVALDGLLEAVPLDEPHGVVGAAVAVAAQLVDRDDARMLQAAGDLGLADEPGPAVGAVGLRGLDLLEGDLAAELLVVRHEHLAETAPGVRPQDAVPRPEGGRGAACRAASGPGLASWRVIPGRRGSVDPVGRRGCGLEGIVDLRGVIREPQPILLRVRDLPGQAAVGQLQAQELPEQHRAGPLRGSRPGCPRSAVAGPPARRTRSGRKPHPPAGPAPTGGGR